MLLPDINKRAECNLKSSCADTLSCTHICLVFPSLLAFSVTKTTLCRYYQRSERGRAYITQSATRSMPTPGHTRGRNRGKALKRGGSDLVVSMKKAPFAATRSHPGNYSVSCPRLVRVSLAAGARWTRV